MSKKQIALPHWITIMGQSGSGKGTLADMMHGLCRESGRSVFRINSGDNTREAKEVDSMVGRRLRGVDSQGLAQPPFVISALWFEKLRLGAKDGDIIIHEGGPRAVREFGYMMEILENRYVDSLKVLEIITTDELCNSRLAERTRKDGRVDLSVDGQPGVPDYNKVKTKMGWWTERRQGIIDAVSQTGLYLSVDGNGSIQNLEKQARELFTFE